ncbi:MAG: hypothetical protein WCI79_03145 [Candidatus Saccharibacteria bacterium]
MNEAPAKIKQQIVDKIKGSANILITVSRDPSVDDLSAALGLTAMLNKIGKHATAIFSGAIPPAITFLEPDKTFENTIDSLRDFIIALDKEKADHLRYKVDGDVVKIFITPYRTTITSNDLEFSQGDYNVELVLALGVENQEHLDMALAAHGQILHDVTVATFSAGDKSSQLGAMDWHEDSASCLSEMVTSLSDALKTDAPLLDKQISTALLTGIVSATDRFSNIKTSSAIMALAAQLMAAGADQQLIAAKLQEFHDVNPVTGVVNSASEGAMPEGAIVNLNSDQSASTLPPDSLVVPHEPEAVADEAPVVAEPTTVVSEVTDSASTLPASDFPPIILDSQPETLPDVLPSAAIESTLAPEQEQSPLAPPVDTPEPQVDGEILSHSYLSGAGSEASAPINGNALPPQDAKLIDIFNGDSDTASEASTLPPSTGGVAATDMISSRDSDEARAAVDAAIGSQPVAPMAAPAPTTGIDLPMPPPVPDFSAMAPPPVPEFVVPEPTTVAPPADDGDPAQFRIPGQ